MKAGPPAHASQGPAPHFKRKAGPPAQASEGPAPHFKTKEAEPPAQARQGPAPHLKMKAKPPAQSPGTVGAESLLIGPKPVFSIFLALLLCSSIVLTVSGTQPH